MNSLKGVATLREEKRREVEVLKKETRWWLWGG
jgi:hypothetical protein